MNVFDRGSFNERARQDRLSSPYHSFNSPSQTKAASVYKSKDWKEGFEAGHSLGHSEGYEDATERFISLNKP